MNDGDFKVDILDKTGHKAGEKLRRDIVKGQDIYHAVYVVLRTPDDLIVLNKIAARQDMPNLHAGSFGCTAATIKRVAESGNEAAKRALKNELGIDLEPELLLEKFIEIDGTHRLIGLYTATAPLPTHYNREDIEELVAISKTAFQETLDTEPRKITPVLKMYWDEQQKNQD